MAPWKRAGHQSFRHRAGQSIGRVQPPWGLQWSRQCPGWSRRRSPRLGSRNIER